METPDLEGAERDIANVERALQRLDDGSYGRCDACGAAIPEDVLAETPAARTCPEH